MNTDKLVAALETLGQAIEKGTLKPVRVDEHTTLVLRHPGVLPDYSAANLNAAFAKAFPGRRTMVLENGMDIQALDIRHQGSPPEPEEYVPPDPCGEVRPTGQEEPHDL